MSSSIANIKIGPNNKFSLGSMMHEKDIEKIESEVSKREAIARLKGMKEAAEEIKTKYPIIQGYYCIENTDIQVDCDSIIASCDAQLAEIEGE